MRLRLTTSGGEVVEETISYGELWRIPLSADESARIEVRPTRRFDVGNGKGRALEAEVTGGENGIIIDARGRPIEVPEEKEALAAWAESLTRGLAPPASTG
jgi:hypothetical protein